MLTKKAAADVCDFLAHVAIKSAAEKQAVGSFSPITGGLAGAGVGSLLGLIGETRKKKRDRRYLSSALSGALAGGGLGAGLSLLPQALSQLQEARNEGQTSGNIKPSVYQNANAPSGQRGPLIADPTNNYYRSSDFERRLGIDLGIGTGLASGLSRTGRGVVYGARNALEYAGDALKQRFTPGMLLRENIPTMYGENIKSNLVGPMGSDSPFTRNVEKLVNVTDPAGNIVYEPGDYLTRPKVYPIDGKTPVLDNKGNNIMEKYIDPATGDWARASGKPKQELRMVGEKIPYADYLTNMAGSPQAMAQFEADIMNAHRELAALNRSNMKITAPAQYAAETTRLKNIIAAKQNIVNHVGANLAEARKVRQTMRSEKVNKTPGGAKNFLLNLLLGMGAGEGMQYMAGMNRGEQ